MRSSTWLAAAATALALVGASCGGGGDRTGTEGASDLSGTITIDGSSTVFPVSEAIAEEFQKVHPGVRVTVGQSGTGGGFKKFCNGETDISDASRPIKAEEAAICREKQIEPVEMKVAIDGLSVLVNPSNSFATCMTVEQLKKAWAPASTVKTWKDIDAKWPADQIKFYGPGADSGTFDYFTEEIVGKSKESRSDYTASEDDNVLVQGIAGDKNALGYFGYAYYAENKDKLKLVAVDGGDGCVSPSSKTIEDGTYTPLSRPIFIYPKKSSLARPEVKAFTQFYVDTVNDILGDVGYIPLPASDLKTSQDALTAALET